MFDSGLIWNLFLAALPVAFGHTAGEMGTQAVRRRSFAGWCGFTVLFFLWLAFVPNTCYLITEWRHFLDVVDRGNLYQQSQQNPRLLFEISTLALFYLFYSGAGILALTLSIRPIEGMLRGWKVPFPVVAPFLFLLLSLGVYLGLIVRLNSWDIWTRPAEVWRHIAAVPRNPMLMLAVFVFALLLWALYEAVDLWIDGIGAKLRRPKKNNRTADIGPKPGGPRQGGPRPGGSG